MDDDELLYLNGINGLTGDYLVPPTGIDTIAALIRGETNDPALRANFDSLRRARQERSLGLPHGVSEIDIRQAGWGIVFHENETEDVKRALEPLIEHRRRYIGNDTLVHVLKYKEGDDSARWLRRHRVSAGSVTPAKVPFYLLLIGCPGRIPFQFSHLLSTGYVTGLLHFATATEYATYAESLIRYETSDSVPNAREAVFFSPRHDFDKATQLSADHLVRPLVDSEGEQDAGAGQPPVPIRKGFRTRKFWGDDATKNALAGIFEPHEGMRPPAFLFTAGHGIGGFAPGDDTQLDYQGALLCQDWPSLGKIDRDHYFAGKDLGTEARVHGLVAFLFACYGAGTPKYDRFLKMGDEPVELAREPFMAALPKALLTHRSGGALACIGHVDRAWGYSITSYRVGPQIQTFENAVSRILSGEPVGYALKDFRDRYVELNSTLADMKDPFWFPKPADIDLTEHWIERNDAEGYVCIGDPAARLRVADLN